MTMKDPRPVQTGLSLRLATAIVTPRGAEELGWDWKEAHDFDLHGMLNEETLLGFADIYDQSERSYNGKPTSLCASSWSSYLANHELLLKGNVAAQRALEQQVKDINTKVYALVEGHEVRVAAPPPPPPVPSDDPPSAGAESALKRPRYEELSGDEDEPLPAAYDNLSESL